MAKSTQSSNHVTKKVFKAEINKLDNKIEMVDQKVVHLDQKVDQLDQKVLALDLKIDDVERRLTDKIDVSFQSMKDYVDSRLYAVDKKFESIDQRFIQVDNRLERLENLMDKGFSTVCEMLRNLISRIDEFLAHHEKRIVRLEEKVQP